MMKKHVIVMLVLMFAMTAFVSSVSANGIGNGSECAVIDIGDGSGYAIIPITVSGASNVGSCDVNVTYDESIGIVVGVNDGDMDSMFSNTESAGDGWIRIGAYQGTNPGLDDFVIAYVCIESVANSGSCPLEVSVTTFKDSTPAGMPMCNDVSNGVYTATSDRDGGHGWWYDDDDNGDDVNVTPTETPTTTPTTSPTASPTANLPGNGTDDSSSIVWVLIIIGIIIVVIIIYYMTKND